MTNRRRCECGWGCESALEHMFWHFMRKTPLDLSGSESQFKIGRYRVDAIVECDGKIVVVELDGKAFHDSDRDWERDTKILQEVDAIIRIPYAAMWYFPEATFEVLGAWFPRFKTISSMFVLELRDLMQYILEREDEGKTRSSVMEELEPNFEIWRAYSTNGYVCSVKALLLGWNVSPIVLRESNHVRSKNKIILNPHRESGLDLAKELTD